MSSDKSATASSPAAPSTEKLDKSAILLPKGMAPFTLANYVKLGQNLSGRDKVMRFAQYGSRAVVYNLGEKTEYGKKLQAFQKAVGLHRKAFKLGVFLDEGLKFLEALSDPKLADLDRYLQVIQRACMVIFTIYDNILWALEVKFVEGFDKANIKMRSYQFRLIAAVSSMIQAYLALSKVSILYFFGVGGPIAGRN